MSPLLQALFRQLDIIVWRSLGFLDESVKQYQSTALNSK
jgi:hypothetical protein